MPLMAMFLVLCNLKMDLCMNENSMRCLSTNEIDDVSGGIGVLLAVGICALAFTAGCAVGYALIQVMEDA